LWEERRTSSRLQSLIRLTACIKQIFLTLCLCVSSLSFYTATIYYHMGPAARAAVSNTATIIAGYGLALPS
jgi:hypothetical protein